MSKLSIRLAAAAALSLSASSAMAIIIPIDTADSANGLTGIYSASFDAALSQCTGSSPSYCSFFGGDPTSGAVLVVPTPSGVISGVPGGIGPGGVPVQPVPAAGSFLDLTLSNGNTTLAIAAGSSLKFGDVAITIPSVGTSANASGAGMVFTTGGSTSVNAEGQAEFLVNPSPGLAVDFSRFSQVVTQCTGGACALITADILNLDMVRYRLFIDWDPTFTSFDGSFIGQTSNNSIVYATLNSTVVPLPAAGWLLLTAVGGLAARRLAKRSA